MPRNADGDAPERMEIAVEEIRPTDLLDEGLMVRSITIGGPQVEVEVGPGEPKIVDEINGEPVWSIVWGTTTLSLHDYGSKVVVLRGAVGAMARARGFRGGS